MIQRIHPIFILFLSLLSFGSAEAGPDIPTYSEISRRDFVNIADDFSVIYRQEHTILVHDRRGLEHAAYSFLANGRCQPTSFEATVTDRISGKVIRKVKLKDLAERSDINDISLYEDDRIKYFETENIPVPFKLELIAEYKCADNFSIRSWFPQAQSHQSVTEAELNVIFSQNTGLRYRTKNFEQAPQSTVTNGITQLQWKLDSITQRETISVDSIPWVQLAPMKFALNGIVSDMSTWEGFGRFYSKLISGKDELPESFKPEVHRMVEGASDDFEKISRLYTYLQKNYRYLIIFLGIDGWEPRKAEEVLATKYGECKGLSTLMKAMLKEVGIEAQYSLVNAGSWENRDLEEDFPVNSFNHAFLRIPLQDEVIWLECTNEFLPAGFSGDFTADRDVFVITGDGGFLDRTPKYAEAKFHQVKNNYSLELQANGDAKFSGSNTYGGFPAIPFWALERYADENAKRSYLNSQAAGNGAIVANFSMQNIPNREVPRTTIDYSGIVQRFAQQTAKRVILPTHWKKMDADFLGEGNLNWEESLEITLLPNLSIESGIGDFKHQDNLFEYTISSQLVENKLIVKSSLSVHSPEPLGKEEKAILVNKINDQFKKTIILKKSELP